MATSPREYTSSDLFRAAANGDIAKLDEVVASGISVDTTTVGGSSVLHYAAFAGHTEMVSHLIEQHPLCIPKGKDRDMQGYNAMHNCCEFSGRVLVYDALVKAGFDKMATISDGMTPLDLATKFKKHHLIQHMKGPESIERKPAIVPEFPDRDSVSVGEATSTLDQIHETVRFNKGDLFASVRNGDVDLLDEIVRSGVPVNATTQSGSSVLHLAAYEGKSKMVSHLVSTYPDCIPRGRVFDQRGFDALHNAAYSGSVDTFNVLINVGFEKRNTTQDGRTVLDLAVGNRNKGMIQHIIGADMKQMVERPQEDSLYDSGFSSFHSFAGGSLVVSPTPQAQVLLFRKWIRLHRCAVDGTPYECLSLIENGADVMRRISNAFFPTLRMTLKTRELLTPMEIARYAGNLEVLELLTRYTTDRKVIDKCLTLCEGDYRQCKPYIVRGILKKKYKNKYIDIVFGKMNTTQEELFVVYTQTLTYGCETSEAGFRVLIRNPADSSKENRKANYHSQKNGYTISDDDQKLIELAINSESENLWKNHSNLKGILQAPVRVVKGECSQQGCMVVLCHFKGFIPDKEPLFPTEIKVGNHVVAVDVREGHFELQEMEVPTALHLPLCMGCNIGVDDGTTRSGTLGPFVQLEDDKLGFITCAHVVYRGCAYLHNSSTRPNAIQVLQPGSGYGHTEYTEEDRVCGKVIDLKYELSDGVFIDAAIVELTEDGRSPTLGRFALFDHNQITAKGITPIFHGEVWEEPSKGTEAIKFGSSSGFTYGSYSGARGTEFSTKVYGKASEDEIWKGVYYIQNRECDEDDCQPPPFSAPGDSGAGVFQLNDDGSLVCIGILVGRDKPTGSGLVIPIKPILDRFGVVLKTFPPCLDVA